MSTRAPMETIRTEGPIIPGNQRSPLSPLPQVPQVVVVRP